MLKWFRSRFAFASGASPPANSEVRHLQPAVAAPTLATSSSRPATSPSGRGRAEEDQQPQNRWVLLAVGWGVREAWAMVSPGCWATTCLTSSQVCARARDVFMEAARRSRCLLEASRQAASWRSELGATQFSFSVLWG